MEHEADQLRRVLALPRLLQPAALAALRDQVEVIEDEEWNTAFGPRSLYATWSETTLMRGLYARNRAVLRSHLTGRAPWRAVELGGGDGRLWSELGDLGPGELWCVDPVPEVHEQVAAALPPHITLHPVVARAEEAEFVDADVAIASLVLHHIGGEDSAERRAHGLQGPGKLEVLEALRAALTPRSGLLVVNEADIHCDLEVRAGDPLLRDRLLDSYVRRCAAALLHDLEATHDQRHRARLRAIVWLWCVDQVVRAELPTERRDVFELDVLRWVRLLERAGLHLDARGFTDPWGLFHQYVARARV